MALKIKHLDSEFTVGDTIRVNYKIKEKGDKERLQAFDGVLIAIKGTIGQQTFIVRKNATDAVVVERIFPLSSPWISSIKKIRSPKVKIRRSKLYYLRNPRVKSL